jgi:hypothetical protein
VYGDAMLVAKAVIVTAASSVDILMCALPASAKYRGDD